MSNSYTKGSDYEDFIRDLIKEIRKLRPKIKNLNKGRNNTVKGASGCKHQIDVSFIDFTDPQPVLVLIECKNNPKKSVPKQQVAAFKAIIDDIAADVAGRLVVKGIFAYAAEAQSGAKKFADYYGIGMENTGVRPNFSFKYKNHIQAGLAMKCTSSASCTGSLN